LGLFGSFGEAYFGGVFSHSDVTGNPICDNATSKWLFKTKD